MSSSEAIMLCRTLQKFQYSSFEAVISVPTLPPIKPVTPVSKILGSVDMAAQDPVKTKRICYLQSRLWISAARCRSVVIQVRCREEVPMQKMNKQAA